MQDKHRHSLGCLSPCIIIQAGSPVIGRVPRTNVLIVSLMSEQINALLVTSCFPNNLLWFDFLKKTLYLWRSIRFMAKLRRRYRDFSYIFCPHTHARSPSFEFLNPISTCVCVCRLSHTNKQFLDASTGPGFQLNSNTIYLELQPDTTGKGLNPPRLPSTSDTSPKSKLFSVLLANWL